MPALFPSSESQLIALTGLGRPPCAQAFDTSAIPPLSNGDSCNDSLSNQIQMVHPKLGGQRRDVSASPTPRRRKLFLLTTRFTARLASTLMRRCPPPVTRPPVPQTPSYHQPALWNPPRSCPTPPHPHHSPRFGGPRINSHRDRQPPSPATSLCCSKRNLS